MSGDPYQTLDVKKDLSEAEIRKAYRRLAKKLHPDLNPGNKEAEDQFKEVSAAYDLLGDPDKRAKFDRGEIDASGFERPRHNYYRNYSAGDAANPYASDAGYADFTDSEISFRKYLDAPADRRCGCVDPTYSIVSASTSWMR